MAQNLDVTLKRGNGTDFDTIYPTTTWGQIISKPSTFTPTAHNHDDSYYTETEIGNILGNGIEGKILRAGQHFMNVLDYNYGGTPTEIIIKTKIPYTSSALMPMIHLQGYAYGEASPIELRIAFYIYNGAFSNQGCTSTCPWHPNIKLFSYLDGATRYVGLALCASIYYPRFSMEYIDIWSTTTRNYSAGWSVVTNTSATTILNSTNISGYADEASVPYRNIYNNITGNATTATTLQSARTINGVSFNGSANITITAAASDVYSWAKASTKPSYNQDEVGDGTTYKRVSQTEKDTWNAKSNLGLGETSADAFRGDRGKAAYDHSLLTHAPSNAQKNSDITKAEIEAKLTGLVTTHEHAFIREGASQNQILFESGIAKFYSEGIGASYDLYHKGNLAAGTGATNFCAGNDARLSDARTPSSHVHGNISNDGKIGSTAGLIIKTGASGVLTTLAAGTTSQYLRGDGIWDTPAGGSTITFSHTLLTYSGGEQKTVSLNANCKMVVITTVSGGGYTMDQLVVPVDSNTYDGDVFDLPNWGAMGSYDHSLREIYIEDVLVANTYIKVTQMIW